ncbi:Hypothetical protein PBC10988_11620 [Planctomycetales bacterium 10988]|nr:Hypothetical protein PBC10988_11620 [Planctomycetales bacterium 10988]
MRLTLRTLLAYLDQVLDPADIADLKQRIAASSVAQSVVDKIKSAMKDANLLAPSPMGTDMNCDPNLTAEYLDNVMSIELVEKFENRCLNESPILGEVADGHHVLKLVLQQPVHPSKARREKLHHIVDLAGVLKMAPAEAAFEQEAEESLPGNNSKDKPEAVTSETAEDSKPTSDPTVVMREERPMAEPLHASDIKAPEPLPVDKSALKSRNVDWRGVSIAGLGLVVILIGLGLFSLMGSDSDDPQVADLDTEEEVVETEVTPSETVEPTTETPAEEETTDTTTEEMIDTVETSETTDVSTGEITETATDSTPEEAASTEVMTATDETETTEETAEMTSTEGTDVATTETPEAGETPATPEENTPPVIPAIELGQYVSGQEVLLHLDPGIAERPDTWKRLPPRSVVYSKDRLVAAPTYTCDIELAKGLNLKLLGGTVIALGTPTEEDKLQLELITGRVVMTALKGDMQIDLKAKTQTWNIRFAEANAKAAVELTPILIPGSNPDAGNTAVEGNFHVISGNVVFNDGVTMATVVTPPGSGTLIPLRTGSPEIPEWIEEDNVSRIDEQAGQLVERELQSDDSVVFRLRELSLDRRIEVRLLAMRTLILMGEFDAAVQALGEETLRPTARSLLIEELRAALAFDPKVGQKMQESFMTHYREDGPALYRMLWGYTKNQLTGQENEAARLVGYLDHNDFVFRALSFWNLNDLTKMTFRYRPELSAERRGQYSARWRDALANGTIVPQENR